MILHPGEFMLGSTTERIAIPDDIVGRLDGKSSLGRLGLVIHSTAGFVDAGWDGHITWSCPTSRTCPSRSIRDEIGPDQFFQMTTRPIVPTDPRASARSTPASAGPTPSRYSENSRSK